MPAPTEPPSARTLHESIRIAIDNPVSRFPRAGHQPERLHGVASPSFTPSFRLSPGQTIFTIGSCFARNIEEHLAAAGFHVPSLDFRVPEGEWKGVRHNGILNKYTPASIRTELELALLDVDDERHAACLAMTSDGQVVDLQLAANVPVDAARGRERRAAVRNLFRCAYEADVAVVTLGQTETWWDATAQMHTNVFPPGPVHRDQRERFYFAQLGYEECLRDVERSIELLTEIGRVRHILLSVSPVPLGRTFGGGDALTAYIGSKSVLRAVAEAVVERRPDVDYLPTFEAVMLTDRSVAFTADLHIPDDVVGEIVSSALSAYLDKPAAVPV